MSNSSDLLGGLPLISCPQNPYDAPPFNRTVPDATLGGLTNPNITLTLIWQTFFFGVFTVLVLLRYNRIRLFGRTIPFRSVKMHLFAWFFATCFAFAAIDLTRYVLNLPYYVFVLEQQAHNRTLIVKPPISIPGDSVAIEKLPKMLDGTGLAQQPVSASHYHMVDTGLLIGSSILRAVAQLLLALALYWDYRYRTQGLVEDEDRMDNERSPLIQRRQRHRRDSVLSRHWPDDDDGAALLSAGSISGDDYTARSMHEDEYEHFEAAWWKDLLFRRQNNRYTFSFERFAIVSFFVHLIFMHLNLIPLSTHFIFFWMYLISYMFLEVPILMFAIMLLSTPTSSREASLNLTRGEQLVTTKKGPTVMGKIYLAFATLFSVAAILPPSIITRLYLYLDLTEAESSNVYPLIPVKHEHSPMFRCIQVLEVNAFSVLDFVTLTQWLSVTFYFLFM